VERELATTTASAAGTDIIDVPAVRIGERVFLGDGALEDAAAYMRACTTVSR